MYNNLWFHIKSVTTLLPESSEDMRTVAPLFFSISATGAH